METRKLQHQLSNGQWADCDEKFGSGDGLRTEEFLLRCEKQNGLSRAEALAELERGVELRNGGSDWYNNCRFTPTPKPAPKIEMATCDCGHTIPRRSVMNASMGTSCPDCYDRMSK